VQLAERADANFAHLVARLLVFATWRLALLDRLTTSADPVLAAIGAKGVKEVTYHRDYAAQWVVRLGDGTGLSHDRMQAAVDTITPLLAELFVPHPTELRLAEAGVAVDPATVQAEFDDIWGQVLTAATLRPAARSREIAGAGGDGLLGRPDGVAPVIAGVGGDRVQGKPEYAGTEAEAEADADGRPAHPLGAGAGSAGAGTAGAGRDGVHTVALVEILLEMQGVARSLPGGVW
jgi:ring-1,2-phenylacetyl-CoA epoxidase subunit PaaC